MAFLWVKHMALKTFTWCVDAGAVRNTELKTKAVQFGDGYEQITKTAINNVRQSWSVTKTAYRAEIDAIYDFLVDHGGHTPFYLNIRGETKTYRTDGAIGEPHQSGDVWRISFNLKQVPA